MDKKKRRPHYSGWLFHETIDRRVANAKSAKGAYLESGLRVRLAKEKGIKPGVKVRLMDGTEEVVFKVNPRNGYVHFISGNLYQDPKDMEVIL